MVDKVVTKKSFIGGHLVYPGEIVDVDEKGEVISAPSTPIGQMSPEQIEAYLKGLNKRAAEERPKFGENVADPKDANTGEQALVMAPFRPGLGAEPQGLPPGSEPHGDRYLRPAPADAPAAVEVVMGPGADPATVNTAGTGAPVATDKPIAKMNKTELLATAKARGIEVADDDTNSAIIDKLNAAANA